MRIEQLIAVISMFSGLVAAQGDEIGLWLSDVTTQDGDAVVHPGETATVSLWMDLDPSVGDALEGGYIVLGYAGARIDVLGEKNAGQGEILSWSINDALTSLGGSEGETDGTNIFGIETGQMPTGGPFDGSDPIFVLAFEWIPTEYNSFSVGYSTATDAGDQSGLFVWKEMGVLIDTDIWEVSEAAIEFSVVPSVATSLVLLPAVFVIVRVRR